MGALTAPTSMALTCRVEEPSTASIADIDAALFDHLVGAGEQRWRYCRAEHTPWRSSDCVMRSNLVCCSTGQPGPGNTEWNGSSALSNHPHGEDQDNCPNEAGDQITDPTGTE